MSFYNESIKRGLTPGKMSEMFVIISTLPETKPDQLLGDLIENSAEPLTSSLKLTDLKKEKIRSPEDLVMLLLTASDQVKYPEESVFKSIANLIASKNIPAETIKSGHPVSEVGRLWTLWVIIGVSVLFFFLIFTKRRKKEKK